MNCDKCPHMKRIKAALAPCQVCEAGRLHHQVSITPQTADWMQSRATPADHTLQSSVTNLSPDDEDKLRRAMSSLFGLDPLDLLVVQHLFRGKSLASFGETMERLHRELHRYRPGATRAMVHAKKEAIIRAFPAIEPIFKHLIDPKAPPRANPDRIDHLLEDDDED